jgi:hypothetical protein
MAAEDRNFTYIDPAHHVESLTSVGEKVKRKKEQEKKRKENENENEKEKKDAIDEQRSEEKDETGKKVEEGHVDFRA